MKFCPLLYLPTVLSVSTQRPAVAWDTPPLFSPDTHVPSKHQAIQERPSYLRDFQCCFTLQSHSSQCLAVTLPFNEKVSIMPLWWYRKDGEIPMNNNPETRRHVKRTHNRIRAIVHCFPVANTIFRNLQLATLNFAILSSSLKRGSLASPKTQDAGFFPPQTFKIELVAPRPSWSRRIQIQTEHFAFVCLFHHTTAGKDIQRKEKNISIFKNLEWCFTPKCQLFLIMDTGFKTTQAKNKTPHLRLGFIQYQKPIFSLNYFVFSIILNQPFRFDLE